MSALRNKLRGKSGASIFMGLMFLLVCLVVGTVVLTASTAASGKLTQLRESEQDYLTVASAARLLRDRICALTYEQKHTEKDIDGFPQSLTNPNEQSLAASDGKVILNSELMELCKILTPSYYPSAENQKSFTISKGTGGPDEWDDVHGSIRMEPDGRLLVKLWLGDVNEDDPGNHNRIELEFCPDGPLKSTVVNSVEHENPDSSTTPPTVTKTITTTTTVTTTCAWPEDGCIITRGTA